MLLRLSTGALRVTERLLQVKDSIEIADVIVILAGGNGARERHAAELYHQGYAPVLVIFWATTEVLGHTVHLTRLACHHLKEAGVPAEAIQLSSEHVRTTYDEARQFATLAQTQGWKKVIVVSDACHSRRAALTFRKSLRGLPVQVMMSPCGRTLTARDDLAMETKLFHLFFEYVKLLYYFARGRLA
jgi:uncharacterized SAM-binding protein YcdF (DUF218 family)